MRTVRVVQLLECDPDLGRGLTAEEHAVARASLPVQAATLESGPWLPNMRQPEPGHLGFLVREGALVRRVQVMQGASLELLGPGDLLRPWQEDASSFCASSWEIVDRSTVIPLGPSVARSIGRWPALLANLIARAVRRSRSLAADAAVANIVGLEERLLILLWQLGETWGDPTGDGVRLPIRLPHRLLADLAGARRPSVTTALSGLQQAGRLAVTPDGRWLLRGDPPY